MQRTIKFRAPTWHSTLGSFGGGDIGRNIDPALAAHLVENGIADYADTEPAAKPVQTPVPAVKVATTRARRAPRAQGAAGTPQDSAALDQANTSGLPEGQGDQSSNAGDELGDADQQAAADVDASAADQQVEGGAQ